MLSWPGFAPYASRLKTEGVSVQRYQHVSFQKKTLFLDNKEIEKRRNLSNLFLKEKSNISVKIHKTHAFKLLHLLKVTDK
jgi:hypothetical protein